MYLVTVCVHRHLGESEIALYDIDEKRLEDSRIILSAINHNVNEDRAVIKTYLGAENRKDALRDADFVVNAIRQADMSHAQLQT